jgi:hypothetical protein
MKIFLESEKESNEEILALLVNLAGNKRNAQLIAGDGGQGIKLLWQQAFPGQNRSMMRLLREIAIHEPRYFLVSIF